MPQVIKSSLTLALDRQNKWSSISTRKILANWRSSSRGPLKQLADGTYSVLGEVEGTGFAQPGEEKVMGELLVFFHFLVGAYGEDGDRKNVPHGGTLWKDEKQ